MAKILEIRKNPLEGIFEGDRKCGAGERD